MKDLLSPKYPAPLVERITGVDLITQRNWIARDLYGSAAVITEPRAGKPRMFPLLAVYETLALALTKREDLELSLFSSAMSFRIDRDGFVELRRRAPGAAMIAAWEGELLEAAREKLFEFITTPKDPYFWIVKYSKIGRAREVVDLRVVQKSQIEVVHGVVKDVDGTNVPGHLVFNITAIVATVDKALSGIKLDD